MDDIKTPKKDDSVPLSEPTLQSIAQKPTRLEDEIIEDEIIIDDSKEPTNMPKSPKKSKNIFKKFFFHLIKQYILDIHFSCSITVPVIKIKLGYDINIFLIS